jgi:hypothetical protein
MKTPPPTQIDDLLKLAFDHAKLVLIGLGEDLMSSFVIVYPDQIHVLQMPWANDDEKLKAVRYAREEMKKHGGALAYSFLTEAWMSKLTMPEAARVPGLDNVPPELLPRNRADRQEIVSAMATNGFETKHASWTIVRDKSSGAVVDLQELPQLPGFSISRFENLLPGERKH